MTEEIARIGRGLAVTDWSSYHPKWSLNEARDARGTQLQEGMIQLALEIVYEDVWEIFRRGESQKSRIDSVFKMEEFE